MLIVRLLFRKEWRILISISLFSPLNLKKNNLYHKKRSLRTQKKHTSIFLLQMELELALLFMSVLSALLYEKALYDPPLSLGYGCIMKDVLILQLTSNALSVYSGLTLRAVKLIVDKEWKEFRWYFPF